MYYRQSQPELRGSVWKQPKSLVQALAYKKGMGGKWAFDDKEKKYFVSQGEQNGHSSRTHRDSTQPYYVSAPSIWRYIAKTLTETAEPSSEMR